MRVALALGAPLPSIQKSRLLRPDLFSDRYPIAAVKV